MTHAPVRLLCLSGTDVLALVTPAEAMAALEDGFKSLSQGEIAAPGRPKIDVPGLGITLSMLAAAPGRMTTQKTVSVFHDNHARGLASHQALISLFDRDTGAPVAIIDGASITTLRTVAAAMVSVAHLARADARIATVVGGGVQAAEHVRQLAHVRTLAEIRVCARSPEQARQVAAGSAKARITPDLEAAVRTSDIVCLTTAAGSPVVDAGWIRPGTHVTSVGYAPPGSEVPPALVERARIFVEAKAAYQPAPIGCAELAGRDPGTGTELGEVLLGRKPGRRSADEITLYKSMGNAMEDLVVANLAYEAAIRAGAGRTVEI